MPISVRAVPKSAERECNVAVPLGEESLGFVWAAVGEQQRGSHVDESPPAHRMIVPWLSMTSVCQTPIPILGLTA